MIVKRGGRLLSLREEVQLSTARKVRCWSPTVSYILLVVVKRAEWAVGDGYWYKTMASNWRGGVRFVVD